MGNPVIEMVIDGARYPLTITPEGFSIMTGLNVHRGNCLIIREGDLVLADLHWKDIDQVRDKGLRFHQGKVEELKVFQG